MVFYNVRFGIPRISLFALCIVDLSEALLRAPGLVTRTRIHGNLSVPRV